MATVTLAQLRTRAKQRANMENSTFLTSAEWNENINYAISELRDIIASKVGDDYFATSENYSLVTGTESYALPATFYKACWVELLGDDGYYHKLNRYEISEQNMGGNPIIAFTPDIRYRIIGSNLHFTPSRVIGGRTARLWYVPLITELSADGDTLNGYNGWDEYPVLKAAIMALEKEESDTSSLSLRLEQLRLRIEAMAENRDQGQPMRIQDNDRFDLIGPWNRW
jgi:hypothetical protein